MLCGIGCLVVVIMLEWIFSGMGDVVCVLLLMGMVCIYCGVVCIIVDFVVFIW